MMAPVVLTATCAIVAAGCLAVRCASAPYSAGTLPWTAGAVLCLSLTAWGLWDLLS